MIAILALQGAFTEHKYVLDSLNVPCFEIRKLSHLQNTFKGLILPGGESTAMGRLLIDLELLIPLRELIQKGLPVFGTCAGLILLAKKLENETKTHLATMDMTIRRNAYGRQSGSFFTNDKFADINIPMTFIRAPVITEVRNGLILSQVNGHIAAARQNNQLVTTYHPELKTDVVHKYFLKMTSAA